jgi:transposase
MISFRSVLVCHEAGELSQIEAGELLGVSERTIRRWCRRYEDDGETGLLDRRLGRPSPRRAPLDDEQEIEQLYRTRYLGFTARHFHDLLVRDHLCRWSYTWTKLLLQSKGLLERAPRRGAHRRKRPRRPLPGMMLRQYADGGYAIFHGPRCIARHDATGTLSGEFAERAGQAQPSTSSPRAKGPSTTLRAASDGGLARARPSLTGLPREAETNARSAPGNGPGSLTRKSSLATPLSRRTKPERAANPCAT